MKKSILIILTVVFVLSMSAPYIFAGSEKGGGEAEKGKEYEIVYVAKLIGIPWFQVTEEGILEASKKYGVKGSLVGPPDPDPAQQARMVEDLVAKGVDAICVAPNDAESLEPVFQKAKEKGIIVLTHESEKSKNNDYDIEMVDNKRFGEHHMEMLVEFIGEEGGYAVMVGGLTVPTHNVWADYAVEFQEKNYPKLYQVTDRIPCTESVELSHDRTLELIKAYPDLKGVVPIGSLGPIGAAQAVREKGLEDKIAVVGTALPSHAAPYLKDGSMKHGILYSPKDAGITVIEVAKWLLDGNDINDLNEIPGVGAITLNGKIIVVDGMIDITAENAESLGF
jgi:simple sugar transport system substrate-binding protein